MKIFSLVVILLTFFHIIHAEESTASIFSERIEADLDDETVNPDPFISWNPRIPKKNETIKKNACIAQKPKDADEAKAFYPHKISFGSSYSYAHLKPSHKAPNHGWLYGLQGAYQYQVPGNLSIGAVASWRQGVSTCVYGTRFLCIIDAQERFGYCLGSYKKERFANLFTGIGYRLNAEHVKTGGQSVHFDYNEFYIPIGFTFDGRVYPVIYVGTSFVWMPQIYPTVKISPLKGAAWDLTYKIANFRIDAPVTFKFYKASEFSLQLNPYFEYWQDGHTYAKSQLGTKLDVPSNSYIYVGFELNLRYVF